MQDWIPDSVWLNVVALSSMTALHDIPDSVFRNDGLWRQWYDAEAPETANVPDYEDRLSKFERMCVVKVSHSSQASCQFLATAHTWTANSHYHDKQICLRVAGQVSKSLVFVHA